MTQREQEQEMLSRILAFSQCEGPVQQDEQKINNDFQPVEMSEIKMDRFGLSTNFVRAKRGQSVRLVNAGNAKRVVEFNDRCNFQLHLDPAKSDSIEFTQAGHFQFQLRGFPHIKGDIQVI